jgi:hypothetical protein
MSTDINTYTLGFCHKISGLCKGDDSHIIVSVRFLALPYNSSKPGTKFVIFRLFTWYRIKLHLVIHNMCHLQVLLHVQSLHKHEQHTCKEQDMKILVRKASHQAKN